jgi:RNA polymerase sigma-70 factor (ECF subfamily)
MVVFNPPLSGFPVTTRHIIIEKESRMDEQQLIALARKGDTVAFGELVKTYRDPILRYLYRLTGDMEKASDLTQDTFLKAFQKINGIRSEPAFKAWLYRIATRTAHSYWRRARLRAFISLDGVKPSSEETIAAPAENIEEKIAVRRALLEVPRNQRECLVLHFVGGFKYREIAATLGISEDAVRKRIARGKEVFRDAYNGGKT